MMNKKNKEKNLENLIKKTEKLSMGSPSEESWFRILREMGTSYRDPSLALKEFITNAIDANATIISIRRKTGKEGFIEIIDNGEGMYLPEEEKQYRTASFQETFECQADSILRLPRSIANSAKRDDANSQGNKALGALAWQQIGAETYFHSKKEYEESVLWYVKFTGDDNNPNYETKLLIESDNPESLNKKETGTTVIIKEISNAAQAKLSLSHMKKTLGDCFSDILVGDEDSVEPKKKVIIYIEDGNKPIEMVEPIFPKGVDPFFTETVNTEFGEIYFELSGDPTKKGKIHLKQGIQTLHHDLGSKIDDLGSDLWSKGYIAGIIKCDWIKSNATRDDIVDNEKSRVFFEKVSELNEKVEEYIKRIDSEEEDNEIFYKDLQKDLYKLLSKRPDIDLADYLSGRRSAKRGKLVPGILEDDITSKKEDYNESVPNKGKDDPKKGTPKGEDLGEAINPSDEQKVPSQPAFNIRFYDRPFHSEIEDKLSYFEQELAPTVVFNSAHPKFIEANRKKGNAKKVYFASIVAKELYRNLMGVDDAEELSDYVSKFMVDLL